MEINRYVAGLRPHVGGNLGRQRCIHAAFQFRQVIHLQLCLQIATDRLGVGCADLLGTDRLDRASIGGDAQQDLQQILGGADIALSLERQVFPKTGLGMVQHVTVRQFWCIMQHGLVILGWYGCTYNPTKVAASLFMLLLFVLRSWTQFGSTETRSARNDKVGRIGKIRPV
jgi:hypothetical protein